MEPKHKWLFIWLHFWLSFGSSKWVRIWIEKYVNILLNLKEVTNWIENIHIGIIRHVYSNSKFVLEHK